ncbi:hypothetical protein ABHF91_00300 [Pseudaeromonas sp. ZJS20]|uniref:hypothetical protein n=1 Tax=Pseudaeromonas aegiceratis TaxID=3153928 RepID=UPI00390C4AD7
MSKSLLLMLPLLPLLLACQPDSPPAESKVGADRDVHGCIPSAGYRWCEQQQACVRPWELTKSDTNQTAEEAFQIQCGTPAN